jgi:hypothetical protein
MTREEDSTRWDEGMTSLLEAERGNVSAPVDAEARAWGRLAAALVLPPDGGGSGPGGGGAPATAAAPPPVAATGVAWKVGSGLYALGVLSGVLGSIAVMSATGPAAPSRPAPAASSATAAAQVERDTDAPATIAELTTTADASKGPAAHPPAPARPSGAPTPENTLLGERVVLDRARAALGRGDGSLALAETDAHAHRYPQGLMAEEREAIAIQALLLVARYDDARQREASFEQKYPRSMLLQAVRASVQSIP